MAHSLSRSLSTGWENPPKITGRDMKEHELNIDRLQITLTLFLLVLSSSHIGNFYYFRVCICSPAYSLRLLLIWWECHVLVWCIHHSSMYEIFPHCNEPHILPLHQQQQWHIWTIDNKKIINKLTTTTVGPTAEIYGERK